MKKIALFVFLIVIAFSANAQNKPSKKETIELIELILNDYSAYYNEYSINGDNMTIWKVDYDYYEYYKNISWNLLEFRGTWEYKWREGYVWFRIFFSTDFKYYDDEKSDGKPEIKRGNHIDFGIKEDKVEALKNAFLRLKEIYK